MSLMPIAGSKSKDSLITDMRQNGLSRDAARDAIKDLVSSGQLCEIRLAREGTRPEVHLQRPANPVSASGEAPEADCGNGASKEEPCMTRAE